MAGSEGVVIGTREVSQENDFKNPNKNNKNLH